MEAGYVHGARRSDLRGAEWALLGGLSVAAVLLSWAHRLNADEGQILTGAWNLFLGRRIYVDFFEFIAPASFEWVAAFFRWFGPTYRSALLASWALLIPSVSAFYLLARHVTRARVVATAVTILWVLIAARPPLINHNSYSTFLSVAFALFVLKAQHSRARCPAALAGGIGAFTFFFLQPKGLSILVAGALALRVLPALTAGDEGERRGGDVLLFAGGAAGVGLVGLWRWGAEPVTTLLRVASGNLSMNHTYVSLTPLAIFLVVFAGLAFLLLRRRHLRSNAVLFLLVLQAALIGSTLHLPDAVHLGINSFPLLLLGGVLVEDVLTRARKTGKLVLGGAYAALCLFLSVQVFQRNVEDTRTTRAWLDGLDALIGNGTFFAYNFLPSFYLEMGVPNPYPNSVLFTSMHPTAHFLRTVDTLRDCRPDFVLTDYESISNFGHDFDNPVDRFLRLRYAVSHSIPHSVGEVQVWRRLDRGDARAHAVRPAYCPRSGLRDLTLGARPDAPLTRRTVPSRRRARADGGLRRNHLPG